MGMVDAGTRECGCVECVQMRMSGKRKKEKKKNTYSWDWDVHAGARACGWPRWCVDAGVLRADADEYKGKRKRKKEPTFLMRMMDAWACGRVAVDVLAC